MAAHDDIQALQRKWKQTTVLFEFYRAGLGNPPALKDHELNQMRHPRKSGWPWIPYDPYDARIVRPTGLKAETGYEEFPAPSSSIKDAPENVTGVGRALTRALNSAKNLSNLEFKYRKALGWGGFGLALLYTMSYPDPDGTGRTEVPVVFKVAHRKPLFDGMDKGLQEEKAWMEVFDCCKHVVQLIMPPGREAQALIEANNQLWTSVFERVGILMEYCPRGSLFDALVLIAQKSESYAFPNRVLWGLFECLFRMCVATAHPFKTHHPDRWQDLRDRGEEGDEQINDRKLEERFIHFDIDPMNIFVGQFPRHGRHKFTPHLKLGDFGLMADAKKFKKPDEYWHRRGAGKRAYYTPEVFTEEWDYVHDFPHTMKPPALVAGNLTYKTNLYQLGQTMWNIITLRESPECPVPHVMVGWKGVRSLSTDNPTGKGKISYGGWLLQDETSPRRAAAGAEPLQTRSRFEQVDYSLRKLVVGCMMLDPADRPSLEEIEACIIEGKMRAVDEHDRGREDEETVRIARDLFAEPTAVQDFAPDQLEQWLEGVVRRFPEHHDFGGAP